MLHHYSLFSIFIFILVLLFFSIYHLFSPLKKRIWSYVTVAFVSRIGAGFFIVIIITIIIFFIIVINIINVINLLSRNSGIKINSFIRFFLQRFYLEICFNFHFTNFSVFYLIIALIYCLNFRIYRRVQNNFRSLWVSALTKFIVGDLEFGGGMRPGLLQRYTVCIDLHYAKYKVWFKFNLFSFSLI